MSAADPLDDDAWIDRDTTIDHRDRAVLDLMARGLSNTAIARSLHISPKTVENRITAIFRKLGVADHPDVSRRVMAVLTYLDGGRGGRT
jgi:DNA-binding NarL/FixJ family response regulator